MTLQLSSLKSGGTHAAKAANLTHNLGLPLFHPVHTPIDGFK